MCNDSDEILFETKDPLNRTVFLSSNRYYGHIISSDAGHQAHPEFTTEEIQKTIESPIIIYKGVLPDNDVYFGRTSSLYPNMFIKVPVALYENETQGEVTTAYLQKHISGGIDEGVIKYITDRLR